MRNDLAERLVPHPGELGVGREEIVRQFIRGYLPKRFEVSTGFAFDSGGRVSQQLDIIVANSLVCPRFETAGGNRFFPCESIVAVGQVKSSLTTRAQLREALTNLESAKSLDRSAGGQAIDSSSDEELDPLRNHLDQIFTFVFAIDGSLTRRSVIDELVDYVYARPPHIWPNVVFAMNKYLATFFCDRGVCPNPMDARRVAVTTEPEGGSILMRFYLLLGRAIEATRVSALPYWEYLSGAKPWSVETWSPSPVDPQPYLHTLRKTVD